MARKDDRFFMSSVKLGPKGQIVIPKEAREMFGLEPGDNLILLADVKRGIALQTVETMNPMMRKAFSNMTPEEVSE
ncbi:MAG: AbrB/MazE/SpoVT family DNA-binding domain-containing protein [Oscillospiraceae bacterium]|jgi:AbrB family looped-hinge helix DNA binding protein|nr:AbrB/MazE/SpoVT family DNA-binding domain-containing protein [Oscillospiraceae bacterium]